MVNIAADVFQSSVNMQPDKLFGADFVLVPDSIEDGHMRGHKIFPTPINGVLHLEADLDLAGQGTPGVIRRWLPENSQIYS